MKRLSAVFFLFPIVFLCLLFTACQSTKPAFNQSSQPTNTITNSNPTSGTTIPDQAAKTVAKTPEKVNPDSAQILLKAAAKRAQMELLNTKENLDDDDDEDASETIKTKGPIQTQKYIRREKEKGNWLSGGFLASGMALLLASLVLVIIGSGPAGLLAIIGGSLFLAGFIFTLVALLSR